MKLSPNSTVRITPDSPFFPTYRGKVSSDGSRITLPGGYPLSYQGPHEGYESPRVPPETPEGDMTYTYHHFDPNGTGELWQCVPCEIVYSFVWGYEE